MHGISFFCASIRTGSYISRDEFIEELGKKESARRFTTSPYIFTRMERPIRTQGGGFSGIDRQISR
jgi:hypothetical protein